MNKELIKNIIIDQRESITQKLHDENIISRDGLGKCLQYLQHPNLLLVSGLRRVGKSIFSHLLVGNAPYAFINYDDERLIEFAAGDFNIVLECFHELFPAAEYLLFDEIQNITGWELFINRCRERNKVIITGSNANLLSHELSTHLTGRYVDFTLYPLSFKEFLRFKEFHVNEKTVYSTKAKSTLQSLFNDYLENGGIIDRYKFGPDFLRNLFRSILTKDIALRYQIRYPAILEEMAMLLTTNFTSKVSVNRLTKHLQLKSPHTTAEYIRYLENSFLLFTLPKFSYKLKEQQSSFKKSYIIDNGLINALSFQFTENKGRFLENVVAIELKRRSYAEHFEFYYWDNYHKECDFVIKRTQKITDAYQVCHELTFENRDREINGLIAALKEFNLKEGIILTASTEDSIEEEGFTIKILPIWKWLLTY